MKQNIKLKNTNSDTKKRKKRLDEHLKLAGVGSFVYDQKLYNDYIHNFNNYTLKDVELGMKETKFFITYTNYNIKLQNAIDYENYLYELGFRIHPITDEEITGLMEIIKKNALDDYIKQNKYNFNTIINNIPERYKMMAENYYNKKYAKKINKKFNKKQKNNYNNKSKNNLELVSIRKTDKETIELDNNYK